MFQLVRPIGTKDAEGAGMSLIEALATAIALLCLVAPLGLVMLCTALGAYGTTVRLLAVSWLIGAPLMVATTFLESCQGASFDSPNVEVSGLRIFARRPSRLIYLTSLFFDLDRLALLFNERSKLHPSEALFVN